MKTFDPAPAIPGLPEHFWNGIDYIKPNETELAILTEMNMKTREDLIKGARVMIDKGVKNVIVTLGKEGCLLVSRNKEEFYGPYQVKALMSPFTFLRENMIILVAMNCKKNISIF